MSCAMAGALAACKDSPIKDQARCAQPRMVVKTQAVAEPRASSNGAHTASATGGKHKVAMITGGKNM